MLGICKGVRVHILGVLDAHAYSYSGCWAVTPKSHLADRIVARNEFVYWPSAEVHGGSLTLSCQHEKGVSYATRPKSRLQRLRMSFRRPEETDLGDQFFLDLRHERFANWSHQLNRYLLIANAIRKRLGEDLAIVVHAAMSGYVVRMYEYFGFTVVRSDGLVLGKRASFEIDKRTSIYSLRPQLVREIPESYFSAGANHPGADCLFLSRKDTRRVTNEAEILPMLESYGYKRVYMEEFSPAEQIAMIRNARHIVSVHGAALAPLQFHNRPDLTVIELLPVGHVTNFYRVMTDQAGGSYMAVRGRMKAKYLPGLYEEAPFKDHTLDDFDVDPSALAIALRAQHENMPLFTDGPVLAPRKRSSAATLVSAA